MACPPALNLIKTLYPTKFQKGLSLNEFLATYGTEDQCAERLVNWRWPDGFVCPECGHAKGYTEVKTRGCFGAVTVATRPR